MREARQCELLGADRPAAAIVRLEHEDPSPRLGQSDCRRQPVGPAADDMRCVVHVATAQRELVHALTCHGIGSTFGPHAGTGLVAAAQDEDVEGDQGP